MWLSKRMVALVTLLAVPLSPSLRAMDYQPADYEVGQALICDTRAQAERFVALFNGDASSAVGVVNAEQHDPTECGILDAAYVRGPSLGLARNGDNAVEIIRLLVIGVKSQGAIRAVNPAAYFSLLRVKEFAV
jgi:hypothetical protein